MITVGLDFGTHQTKICIEDASNAIQKTYRFFEFEDNGKISFFLPSIVQINEDNKVSYGFIDDSKRLSVKDGFLAKQIFILKKPELKKPELSKPEKHLVSNKSLVVQSINREYLKARRRAKKEKKYLEKLGTPNIYDVYNGKKVSNKNKITNNSKKQEHEIEYEIKLKDYNKTLNEYQKNLSSLDYLDFDDEGNVKSESMIFHYLKFAVFSDKIIWYHQIEPDVISIWYLCNVLFMLQKELGEEFSIQMGIPCGINQKYDEEQNEKGLKLLISAYNLLEKFDDYDTFLKTDYISLLEKTRNIIPDISKKEFYGIVTMPEAFGALSAVTKGRKLQNGMSLLVDIGGGTTDIAFFTINEKEKLPDIHTVSSIYTGLNDVFQGIAISEGKSVIHIQDNVMNTGLLDLSNYTQVKLDFSSQINEGVNEIISILKNTFREQFENSELDISKLIKALENRPVIFSGGGSTFQDLRFTIKSFKDVKVLDSELLKIPNLLNENIDPIIFTILATSYGLSQAIIENDIILTPLSKIFAHIDMDPNNSSPNYVHGLTDH